MTDLTSFNKTDLVDDVLAAFVNGLLAATLRAEYSNTETLSATKELDNDDTPIQILTASSTDRTVELAPENTSNHVTAIFHSSTDSYDLIVKDDSGATTFSSLPPGGFGLYVPSGVLWEAVGGDISPEVPNGYLINGKLDISISSDDLVVAIKTLAGADPSAGDPVYVRIGDVEHTLSAALSVTAADATNWCNAGAAETAALEVPFFTYLGYNATDGVVIGFSRISSATKYSDFSVTSTNEKYCKISDITTAGASDVYENVGYFHAILSAAAGHVWTLPGTSVVISRPKRNSNLVSWQPTIVGYSADPTDDIYQYEVMEDGRVENILAEGTSGTADATTRTYTLPFTSSLQVFGLAVYPIDNGSAVSATSLTRVQASTNVWDFANPTTFTAWTDSGTSRMRGANITITL